MPSSEEEGEGLTCSICICRLDKPVSLLCGHSFCKGCLGLWIQEKQAEGVTLTCPLDRLPILPTSADHVNLALQVVVERKRRREEAMAHKARELRSIEVALESARLAVAAAALEQERHARDLKERECHKKKIAAKLVAGKAAAALRREKEAEERRVREAAAVEAAEERAEAAAARLQSRKKRVEDESKARGNLERQRAAAVVAAAAAAPAQRQQQLGGTRTPDARKAALAPPAYIQAWRCILCVTRPIVVGARLCFSVLAVLFVGFFVYHLSRLWLEGDLSLSAQVYVRTLTGGSTTTTTTLYVDYLGTVGDVKAKLARKLGHPPAQQRLTYGGEGLDDDRLTLPHLPNLGRDSTLHLFLRPDGDTCAPIYEGELWEWLTTPPTFNVGSIMLLKSESLPPLPYEPASPAAAVAALAAELLAPSTHRIPKGPQELEGDGLDHVRYVGALVDAMWRALREDERHSSSPPIDWLRGEAFPIQRLRGYMMGRDGGEGGWDGGIVTPYADLATTGLSRLWAAQHPSLPTPPTPPTAPPTPTTPFSSDIAADVLAPVRYLVALVDASYIPGCLVPIRAYRRLLFLLLWGNPALVAGVVVHPSQSVVRGKAGVGMVRALVTTTTTTTTTNNTINSTPTTPTPPSTLSSFSFPPWNPKPTLSPLEMEWPYPPTLPSPSSPEWEEVLGWSKPGVRLCGEEWYGVQWAESLREQAVLSLGPYWDTSYDATALDEGAGLPALVERAHTTVGLFKAALKLWAVGGGGWIRRLGATNPSFDAEAAAASFVYLHSHLLLGGNLQQQLGGRGLSAILKDLDAQILGTAHIPRLWPALVALVLHTPFDLHRIMPKEGWKGGEHKFLSISLQKHLFEK